MMEDEMGKEVVIDIEAQPSIQEKKDNQPKKLLSKTTSGVLNYNVPKDENISSNAKPSRHDNVEVMVDNITRSSGSEERAPLVMNNIHGKEKRKVKSSKKPWKPPRPPKGPSLTASDAKLVKEIYDLKIQKRATTKRIRALAKSRVEKLSSSGTSTSTLTAMIVTIIFITIIFLQGPLSRRIPFLANHESPSQPSPEPKGLITIKFPKLSTKANAPSSNSKSLRLEEVPHHEFNSPG